MSQNSLQLFSQILNGFGFGRKPVSAWLNRADMYYCVHTKDWDCSDCNSQAEEAMMVAWQIMGEPDDQRD